MLELQEILKSLEELRGNLIEISDGKSMNDPKVVFASQMLDAVLNKYYKLMKDNTDSL
jgi:hypothetical protein